jgi:nitroreductase
MGAYEEAVQALRRPLPAQPTLRDLVRYATLAPNAHNTQPWRFRLGTDHVDVLPDFTRRTPVVDPDDHHLYVTLGCAAENLAIAGNASGRPAAVSLLPERGEGTGVRVGLGRGAPSDTALCAAIPERQSTRSEYDGTALSSPELEALARAATLPGVQVCWITHRGRLEEALAWILEGNDAQLDDAAFVRELKDWIRFNRAAALASGDGLLGACSGSPSAPDWLGPLLFTLAFRKGPERAKLSRQLRSSAGLAVFVADEETPEGWIRVGRAFERFALQATALGIRHAHVNMPVEAAAVRPAFAAWLGLPGQRPDLVIRFGRASPMPWSMRRPLDEVIVERAAR